MSNERDPLKTKMAAQRKAMDIIAKRDHSEKELRQKLRRKFSGEEGLDSLVDDTIEFAKEYNLIGEPDELAGRMADMLHRRNKGIHYINNYLREKGLPTVGTDRDLELEKALHLVKNKYPEDSPLSREEKARLGRFLVARGFDSETVRKVLYEKL